ncbi:MAG: molecular chaperone TorD family protein [Bacteroidetes bacterium]|nr:molecular chaperone TorD family protein [Bacteroidota bacterium]
MYTTETDIKLVKADLFRVISKGFSYPEENNIAEIREIVFELSKRTELNIEYKKLLLEILKNANYKTLLSEYSRLFLKGTVPVSESTCLSKLNSVTDVAAFYKAFGMTAKSGESPDAITYQLEFLSLLLVKMSIAKNKEQLEITKDAYVKFINDHLLEFSGKFSENLSQTNPNDFYSELSSLLVKLIHEESEFYAVKN